MPSTSIAPDPSSTERGTSTLATDRSTSLPRTIAAALGLTTAFFLWLLQPGVETSSNVFYHWSGDPENLFLAIAIDMLGAWLLLTLLLLIAQKPGRIRVAVWTGLLSFMPWAVYVNYRLLHFVKPYPKYSCPLFVAALLGTPLFTVLWRPAFSKRFEGIVASATTILIFVGLFGAFLLCKLAWNGWKERSINPRAALHHQQASEAVQPHRIIWIVFDELSNDQVYEHRFPGLHLPAFDALASESTRFTNVLPSDIHTEIVLPSLITGRPFDAIEASPAGKLSSQNSASGQWQAFNQHDTVFQDALDRGYATAVAGWYNPYCRIMPQVLDQCFWVVRNRLINGMISSESVAYNAKEALGLLGCVFLSVEPRKLQPRSTTCRDFFIGSEQLPESHIRDYEDLNAAAQKLLRDRSAGFVLLHLPVPHPPGIYDRAAGKLTTGPSTYIDNLALADKCLAGLRATLEQTGQWDSSTIVIMGDHSWRTTQIWRPFNAWSAEEEKASNGGKYDPHPGYIVKLPGQTTPARINTLYHAVNTRKLFDQLLAHKITTPAELSAWAQSVH